MFENLILGIFLGYTSNIIYLNSTTIGKISSGFFGYYFIILTYESCEKIINNEERKERIEFIFRLIMTIFGIYIIKS